MEVALVFAILIGATVLLVTEAIRADLVAMLVLAALLVTRLIDLDAAFSGFSNRATVTVACMFLISAGLQASGLVGYLGDRLLLHGPTRPAALLVVVALVISPVSAFINNTAVVAIFLPIVVRACQGNRVSPSFLMMPLSFFAMLGGTCTLIGTSTNILVSDLAESHGIAPFKMFEFTLLGLALLAAGTLYMLFVARHLMPATVQPESRTQGFAVNRYLSEVLVLPDSPLIGQSVVDARVGERYDLEVLAHVRGKVMRTVPGNLEPLAEGDLLLVNASAEALMRIREGTGLAVKPGRHPDVADLRAADTVLLEAVVTPTSDLEGRTLKGVNFRNRFGATTLAIRRHGLDVREKIGRLRLSVGDELLILAPRRNLSQLRQEGSFVILEEHEVPTLRPFHAALTLAVTAGVVVSATTGLLDIAAAAVVGSVIMVVSGCLPKGRVYQSIEWRVIFLLAGLIPLGVAMEQTGAAGWVVESLLRVTGDFGPTAVLALFFLMASVMTGFMSNTATAALLAPLALSCGQELGVDPRPFLVALTFAASAAFWTPIGYQTNLLVYGPGQYRFIDYVKVGGPLTLISWAIATVLIPRLYPF